MLSSLAALVDESLVRQSQTALGEPRFTMLETVREFGLEALAGAGEESEIRTRHAAWVVHWVDSKSGPSMDRSRSPRSTGSSSSGTTCASPSPGRWNVGT